MKKISLALFAVFVSSLSVFGQGARNIKINEVMTNNTASIVDEYGRYNGWLELSNIAYSSYNVRVMYITTNRDVLKKELTVPQRIAMMSVIPNGDERTLLSARKHLILYFGSNPAEGMQHLTVKAEKGKALWVALYDGNAVDLIDSVTVPALAPNLSYARVKDGADKWVVKTADEVTPGSNNYIHVGETKIAKLKREDPHGYGIAILSMGIVFSCLALLYVFFRLLGIFMSHKQALKKAKDITPVNVAVKAGEKLVETGHKTKVILKDGMKSGGVDKEVYIAVISMALKQYQDNVHDVESNIITIKPHHTMWNVHLEDTNTLV